jgi:hypothetical protein
VTQPRPGRTGLLGQVAVQLGHQAGDQHGVPVIALAPGIVLALPGPRGHQRLHTHHRHAPLRGQLADHHPPVPSRLARHRDPRKARRARLAQRPFQQFTQLPRRAAGPPPRDHPRIMIGQDSRLPRLGKIDAQDRMITRNHRPQRRQPGVTVAVTPRQAIVTLIHGRPPRVLGYQARHHTRRTSWPQPLRGITRCGIVTWLSCRCTAVIRRLRRSLSDCPAESGDGRLGVGGFDAVGLSWTSWDMIQKMYCAGQRFRGVTDAGRTERGFHGMGNGEFAGQRLFRCSPSPRHLA